MHNISEYYALARSPGQAALRGRRLPRYLPCLLPYWQQDCLRPEPQPLGTCPTQAAAAMLERMWLAGLRKSACSEPLQFHCLY